MKKPSQVCNSLTDNTSTVNLMPSKGLTKFHIRYVLNLVKLGESPRFHTETLTYNKLSNRETCEGYFLLFSKLITDSPLQ